METLKEMRINTNLNSYFVKQGTSDQNSDVAPELALCYHNTKHGLSYNSFDCNTKLIRHVFGRDSEIARKLSCGRTKAEAFVMNFMAPKSVDDFVKILKSPEKCEQLFSIATDASNKGNRKMFPVCVHYFDACEGIQWKVLDFIEDSDESAAKIHKNLKDCIQLFELSLNKMVSYSADNANVNFGKK